MRNTLEYSGLAYISISEEINFIESYLDLEKLRFDDRFETHIEAAPEIPVYNYFIPPLLLQPILENSVKHAFKNIPYQGQLDIQFLSAEEEGMLQVIICDNGPGIQINKEKSHQSMSLSIIENRIKILNLNNKRPKSSFRLFNRLDSEQAIIGTQAIFIIPIQLKRND